MFSKIETIILIKKIETKHRYMNKEQIERQVQILSDLSFNEAIQMINKSNYQSKSLQSDNIETVNNNTNSKNNQ